LLPAFALVASPGGTALPFAGRVLAEMKSSRLALLILIRRPSFTVGNRRSLTPVFQ